MFDLNNAVDEWSRSFAGTACGRTDRVEELKDHLFCEIEQNVREGLNEESAFLAATRRFGISEEIKSEFGKGKSIASILCEADAEFGRFNLSTKQMAVYTGIYLVLYAGLTFGLAALLRGTDTFVYFTPLLYVLMFVPIFFSSALRKQGKAECSFIKRKLGFGKK